MVLHLQENEGGQVCHSLKFPRHPFSRSRTRTRFSGNNNTMHDQCDHGDRLGTYGVVFKFQTPTSLLFTALEAVSQGDLQARMSVIVEPLGGRVLVLFFFLGFWDR